MLTEIVDGVLVRQSSFCQSNAVLILGRDGGLLVDPGVDGDDLTELAGDLERLGVVVTAGFSTHPHWDHVLWHPRFGDVARYGTSRCAAVSRARRGRWREIAARFAPGAPLGVLGAITALPEGAARLPLDGRSILVIEHHAHAPGHAALLVEDAGVLVAGDMLSDVEIPLFDPDQPDQCDAYLVALDLLAEACRKDVGWVVPGHGSVARGAEIPRRLEADRSYVHALQLGADPADPRVGADATYGRDWLPEAHEENVRLAQH